MSCQIPLLILDNLKDYHRGTVGEMTICYRPSNNGPYNPFYLGSVDGTRSTDTFSPKNAELQLQELSQCLQGYVSTIRGVAFGKVNCPNKVEIVFKDRESLIKASSVTSVNRNSKKTYTGCHSNSHWKVWINVIPERATSQRVGWVPNNDKISNSEKGGEVSCSNDEKAALQKELEVLKKQKEELEKQNAQVAKEKEQWQNAASKLLNVAKTVAKKSKSVAKEGKSDAEGEATSDAKANDAKSNTEGEATSDAKSETEDELDGTNDDSNDYCKVCEEDGSKLFHYHTCFVHNFAC